jgi:hypothetical protein
MKHTQHTFSKNRSCPPSLTPTRLADGLEAKKSSSEKFQMRPDSWFPRVVPRGTTSATI